MFFPQGGRPQAVHPSQVRSPMHQLAPVLPARVLQADIPLLFVCKVEGACAVVSSAESPHHVTKDVGYITEGTKVGEQSFLFIYKR